MEEATGESDEDLEYKEQSQKTKSWSRLKSKIHGFRHRQSSLDAQDSSHVSGDGGISDFLYSTDYPPKDRSKLQPPQIDVSAAKAADDQNWEHEVFKFRKPPRAIGLKVAFVASAPEVIGIGGEESEEPVTWISRRRYSAATSLPHRPSGSQSNWPQTANLSTAPVQTKGYAGASANLKAHEPPTDTIYAQNYESAHPEHDQLRYVRKPEAVPERTYSQMRADEGRTFLAASLGPGKGLRRKPVAFSDSESDSRSRSPATSQQASPPPSRGSDDHVFPTAQYPKPLLPSHLQNEGWSSHKMPQTTQQTPESSGSDTYSRGRLRRMEPTEDLRSEQASIPAPVPRPQPTSHPPSSSQQIRSQMYGTQAANHQYTSSADRLELPSGTRSRSSSNQSIEGIEDQNCLCRTHLKGLGILKTLEPSDATLNKAHLMPWSRIHVFTAPQDDENDSTLRVICFDSRSSFTDFYTQPVKFKLDRSSLYTLILPRQPSSHMGISISPNVRDDFLYSQLRQAQGVLRESNTTLTFNFHSNSDLHKFQEAITGYSVRFDGIAKHFSISRRRMMVSIHKSYETADARIQVVRGHNRTFLVAFFSEYSLADCLHFELKSFDVFESSESRDETFVVKLVDAKFSLPDSKGSERPEYIAMDSMEPAGEHEDITIGFGDEKTRDEFSAALPAAVTSPRRFTLKRRI